jgi:uncharacterized protein
MTDPAPHGATAVITHQVRDSRHAEYEKWLTEIVPLTRASPGHLDIQLVRPVRGVTDTYTILLRFDTEENLRHWIESDTRRRLIDSVKPILAQGDSYTIHSGLDFLFTPRDASHRVPVRWKQFLITWSAIFPLSFLIPMVVAAPLRWLGWHNKLVVATVVSALAVFMMVYVIMPRYTRLVRHWLFR